MSPDTYQKLANRTASIESPDLAVRLVAHSELLHAAIGAAGEAGELADAVKKSVFYGQPLNIENVCEEIGDVLWYIALAASSCGLKLSTCMQYNVSKLEKRYKSGKFTEKEAAERADKK